MYCVPKGARPVKVSMNNISGSYAVVPSSTAHGSQAAHLQHVEQTLAGELRCAWNSLATACHSVGWQTNCRVKQCISGKQHTGKLPLTLSPLYNILFYYLLLLIAFNSPCRDTGEWTSGNLMEVTSVRLNGPGSCLAAGWPCCTSI